MSARYVVAIRVRDGCNWLHFGLVHAITAPSWRMWVAVRAFRVGARLIGADIKLVKRIVRP